MPDAPGALISRLEVHKWHQADNSVVFATVGARPIAEFPVNLRPRWREPGLNGVMASAKSGDRSFVMGVERRLAAVLAADVVGYSRLMGTDEMGTLTTLDKLRQELIEPSIATCKGRIVKTTGDGLLGEFANAVDAVTCAMAVQSRMQERNKSAAQVIAFRIGINVGDIIVHGGDIFGDCVNVAARIENECEPGGVYLSGSAFEQLRGKTGLAFDDLGERSLKNIDRPVRLFALRAAPPEATAASPSAEDAAAPASRSVSS
jgi:adenylate cyclase